MKDKIKDIIKSNKHTYAFAKWMKAHKKKELPQQDIMNFMMSYYQERFYKYSGCFNESEVKKDAYITWLYHVIEKGLSMPEMRLGFGREKVEEILQEIKEYKERYGTDSTVYKNAVAIVLEYDRVHKENKYEFETSFQTLIDKLRVDNPKVTELKQSDFTSDNFYKDIDKNFSVFVSSRHSVRNYSSVEVPIGELISAIDLAKTAPSACNRQPTRIHIVTNNELIRKSLSLQNGNRGFGQLANKLMIITGDLRTILGAQEIFDLNTNVGIFIMNLCNALHEKKIAHCILNWYAMPKEDMQLRKIIGIPNEENITALIVCGYVPEKFKIAESPRFETEKLYTIHM